MADTVRTLAALQALLADNTSAAISPQDIRDFLVSVYPDDPVDSPVIADEFMGGTPASGQVGELGWVWENGNTYADAPTQNHPGVISRTSSNVLNEPIWMTLVSGAGGAGIIGTPPTGGSWEVNFVLRSFNSVSGAGVAVIYFGLSHFPNTTHSNQELPFIGFKVTIGTNANWQTVTRMPVPD